MTSLALTVLFLLSCGKEPLPIPPDRGDMEDGDTTEVMATVSFDVHTAKVAMTKGAVPQDRAVSPQIFAFKDGAFAAKAECDESGLLQMTLEKDTDYSFYAFSDYPEITTWETEAELKATATYCIDDLSVLEGAAPMTWKGEDCTITKKDRQTVRVYLERIYASVGLQIDRNELIGLEITHLQLKNAALTMHPFGAQRSKASEPSELTDAMVATPEQLSRINSGEAIRFKVLENCQGTLLKENKNPWHKFPVDLIGKESELCTYIDMQARFKPESLFDGELHFTFFLGKDSRRNFDVERNTETLVRICLAGENKDALGWEVIDMSPRLNNRAKGEVLRSRNTMGDLYLGQTVDYSVTVDADLVEELGGDISGLKIVYTPTSEGDISITEPTVSGKDKLLFSFTATKAGSGRLCLVGESGEELASLESLFIQQPSFVFSTEPAIDPEENARDYRIDPFTVTVNTDGVEEIFLYATDKKGFNLNDPKYDYDPTVFSFDATVEGHETIKDHLQAETRIPEEEMSGVFAYSPVLSNDGKDEAYNKALSESYAQNMNRLYFTDANNAIEEAVEISVAIPPLDVRMMASYFANMRWPDKYFKGGWEMMVVNRSRIPVDITIWHLGQDSDCQSGNRRPDKTDIQNADDNFTRTERTYLIDRFKNSSNLFNKPQYEHADHFYSHDETLRCSYLEDDTQEKIENGDTLVYAINMITTNTIGILSKAEARDVGKYHHIVDITLNGETLRQHDLDSAKRNIVYFGCDYDIDNTEYENHTGTHCYSNERGPETDWKGLTPAKLTSLTNDVRKTTVIKLWYNEVQHTMLLYTVGGNPYGLTVDARVTAVVESQCRDKQGNFAPHIWPVNVTIEKNGIKLDDTGVNIDTDFLFHKAMRSVSNTEYKWSTFKKQYTYPTHIRYFTLELKLSGENHRIYPIELRYGNTTSFAYKHWSDKNDYKTYYPPGVPGQWYSEANAYVPYSAGLYTVIDWEYKH